MAFSTNSASSYICKENFIEHNHTHSFTIIDGYFYTTVAKMNSYERDYKSYKA